MVRITLVNCLAKIPAEHSWTNYEDGGFRCSSVRDNVFLYIHKLINGKNYMQTLHQALFITALSLDGIVFVSQTVVILNLHWPNITLFGWTCCMHNVCILEPVFYVNKQKQGSNDYCGYEPYSNVATVDSFVFSVASSQLYPYFLERVYITHQKLYRNLENFNVNCVLSNMT